jgi:hypothetical protein
MGGLRWPRQPEQPFICLDSAMKLLLVVLPTCHCFCAHASGCERVQPLYDSPLFTNDGGPVGETENDA